MQRGQFQSGVAIFRFDDGIAGHLQIFAREFAHSFFIFDQ